FEEALKAFAAARDLDPQDPDTSFNEGLTRLLLGDFAAGWKLYEWRWQAKQRAQLRSFTAPLWLGVEPLAGKTILVHAEQGYGDTTQFVRYAPMLAARGARIVLEVQPPLKALLEQIDVTVLGRGEPLPAFDLHCPILSLPLALGTELATIPPN